MANDTTLDARRAIITAMRATPALTALVPAARIFPPQVPANPKRPFIRYGVASWRPEQASCLDGALITVTIDAFANGPGEDVAAQIGAAIAKALDGMELVTEAGDPMSVTITGGRVLQDPEDAGVWHAVVLVEALVVSGE